MLHLELAAEHSLILSPVCARCPSGRVGCCASPPAVAWADIGRIASLGGSDFLLEQIRLGNLRPSRRGLSIRRLDAEEGEDAWPARCVYLGKRGCILSPDRRSATCNYYICDDALAEGDEPEAERARRVCEQLTEIYGTWDLEIQALVEERFPDGPAWDLPFLNWLGGALDIVCSRDRGALRDLGG